ncbi:MAG: class I SAM-dependent DNA methyltransferase [Phycisphaeraceae bacterium]|nr:class I SAM-dependent DNA methyltransferase [Phycisphaeraceae bacterium]
MQLSLSEIRQNAIRFAAAWSEGGNERADAQEFWIDLFAVFGVKRRSVASFEERVRNARGTYSRLDVFYSAVMIGEHKSRGEDLSKAKSQAFEYVEHLTREGRELDVPQHIVLSDFENIVIYDLDGKNPGDPIASFKTAELPDQFRHLLFLAGRQTRPIDPEDPINIRAVEILGQLHDALERGGYVGYDLERFLVRVLFCLFADSTGIFPPDCFKTIVRETREDGFGLGAIIEQMFQVLDRPREARVANLPEIFAELPYVNGRLFAERLRVANFDADMRQALLKACNFNWARISPAVFGSLFQSIMAGDTGQKKRRQIGAHYTSERDIMKLVRALFLDDLEEDLKACGSDRRRLLKFQDKLASLRFLDPACGCGNFLVVTYRELRRLELEMLLRLHEKEKDTARLLLDSLLKVDVDQMHGMEIEEWPALIAEVALWLIDHQMNQRVGEAFGEPVLRLPLKKSAHIVKTNALRHDWNQAIDAGQCSYVLGNPPFVGSKWQNDEQRADMKAVAGKVKSYGLLDYVTGWYIKASEYIQNTRIRCAFVSTNSITQGEQVGVLWPALLDRGIKIHFAHRTFAWTSEARGKAHVHVVIIGFGAFDLPGKTLYDYPDLKGEPIRDHSAGKTISPYLVFGPEITITNRSQPLCKVPRMVSGNKPIDDGHYLFTPEEKRDFLAREPQAEPLFRRWLGGHEFINGVERWFLLVSGRTPSELRSMPHVLDRIEAVRKFRAGSKSEPTRRLASTPTEFHTRFTPKAKFLAMPQVSSERRQYIPVAYLDDSYLPGDKLRCIADATPYHFGVMVSAMHMAWVRHVTGRLKSDYQYSIKLVYNNFPWPESPGDRQVKAVERAAQGVLDARARFPDQTLADLYDPRTTPPALVEAHRALDRAVDRCYRPSPFEHERGRVEYLFGLYQRLITPLTAAKSRRAR